MWDNLMHLEKFPKPLNFVSFVDSNFCFRVKIGH